MEKFDGGIRLKDFGDRLKALRKHYKFRQVDLAKLLGVTQTTIANYETGTRFPDMEKLRTIADTFCVSIDVLVSEDERPYHSIFEVKKVSDDVLINYQKDYLFALRQQSKQRANEIIDALIQQGSSVEDIYLKVMMPSLVTIGHLWSVNKLSVGEEHFASYITMSNMNRLPIIARCKKKHVALAVSVSGEAHNIGLQMVSHLLEIDGWQVYFIGSHTPVESIIDMSVKLEANLLVLSTTLESHLENTEKMIGDIRQFDQMKSVKILVGGQAYRNKQSLASSLGADGYSHHANDAVTVANRLVNK